MSTIDDLLAAAQVATAQEFGSDLPAQAPEQAVEAEVAPETPDTPEPTTETVERLRGADGRFLPRGDSAEEEVPADAGIEPEAEQQDQSEGTMDDPMDPDVLELDAETLGIDADHILFTKYGGDLGKALGALSESQRLVGERANEVGSLRQENEQLNEVLQRLQSLESGIAVGRVDWDTLISESPQQAAEYAAHIGSWDHVMHALDAWALESPIAPVIWLQALQQKMSDDVTQTERATTLEQEMDSFKERNPDYEALMPAIQDLAAQRPVAARALAEGSPQERAQALQDLYDIAKSRRTDVDTSAAARRVILRARAEADQAKADAAVVGASRTNAAGGDEPLSGDRLLEQALRELSGSDDFVIKEREV